MIWFTNRFLSCISLFNQVQRQCISHYFCSWLLIVGLLICVIKFIENLSPPELLGRFSSFFLYAKHLNELLSVVPFLKNLIQSAMRRLIYKVMHMTFSLSNFCFFCVFCFSQYLDRFPLYYVHDYKSMLSIYCIFFTFNHL